ncbi:restriction endonuclease, partial [Corynebacterium diphtheriae]
MSESIPVQGMPTHLELVPYLLRSLVQLGGTGKNSEIEDTVIDIFPDAEQLL